MLTRYFCSGSIIFLITTVLALSLAEGATRYLLTPVQFANRYFFWSSPALVQEPDGAMHYTPHARIREVAVFGSEIEYDSTYSTNNFGLVDQVDYISDRETSHAPQIAVVGDSFSAGNGGQAWPPLVRGTLSSWYPHAQIFNLSVLGGAFEMFRRNLAHFSRTLAYSHIIIAAISDDFYRVYWRPISDESGVRLCPASESDAVCLQRRPFATYIGLDDSHDFIAAKVKQRAVLERSAFESENSEFPFPLRYSFFLTSIGRYVLGKPAFALAENYQQVGKVLQDYLFKQNKEELIQIRQAFPTTPITFLHIPERAEVMNKRYRLDPQPVLSELGIPYVPLLTLCTWSTDLFYVRDTHPNRAGYEHLANCIRRLFEYKNVKFD